LIFSKLQCGHFPEPQAVVDQISAIAGGAKPEMVTEYEKSSCTLL
uniref:Microcystin LR degradation protein MlrC-like protein n=1 Tax=Echinostoma caproni TaxID=27848 RepID=A0A183A924_9TREM